jgi:dolichol-phosphate mannosyltransferase
MKLSVIIPTYNEAENIASLIEKIHKHARDAEIIVVDDNSPDRTADIVAKLRISGIKLFVRKKEKGLSSAVIAGFRMASGDAVCVMDADHSHPPELIPKLRKALEEADFVLASRYVKGGGCEHWPLARKIISKAATLLARPLTTVSDPMSGFFMFRRHIIDGVELRPEGFKIGLEILVKARPNVKEVPFIFKNRFAGKSKLGMKTNLHYLHHLINLYRYKYGKGKNS